MEDIKDNVVVQRKMARKLRMRNTLKRRQRGNEKCDT